MSDPETFSASVIRIRNHIRSSSVKLGWCPVENDTQTPMAIREILNFTIFIKNFIEFPTFNVKHKNMVENLRSCVFHPKTHKDCPIFRLDYILNEAESDLTEQKLMLRFGGVIRVKIDWDCDLDRRISRCKPKYSFARLDTRFSEETFSVGFNFRFAYHWRYQQTYSRSLNKAYGLRLIISVSGKAGKFDFITLTLNTGSLVGIFGLATFVCDLILLHLTKKATVYREYIFQRVETTPTAHTASSSTKRQPDKPFTVYVNRSAIEPLSTSVWRPLEANARSPRKNSPTNSSVLIHPDELRRLKPSLGLTNTMHWRKALAFNDDIYIAMVHCTVDFLWYGHHDRYWFISKRFTSLQVTLSVSAHSASPCTRRHRCLIFYNISFCYLFGKMLCNKSIANFDPFFIRHSSVDIVELMSE